MFEGRLTCACGCDEEIVWKPWMRYQGITEFLSGHNARVSDRTGGQFPKGVVPWDRGLTKETDNRVKTISDKLIGKPLSQERRVKCRLANLGRHHTDDSKKKMSKSRTGDKNPFYGKTHTEKFRKQLSELNKTRRGEFAPNWRGGLTRVQYPDTWTDEYKHQIRVRDGVKCALCLCKDHQLDVHHIDYDKNNCSEKNLITLCHPCHLYTNGDRKFWIDLFADLMGGK